MKIIPVNLLNHYKEDATTLATIFKITCKDGTKLGFTTYSEDIVLSEEPDVIYMAQSGLSKTAIASSNFLNVDNLDVEGFLEDTRINDADIINGKYDKAEVLIAELNYTDTPYQLTKCNILKTGVIGEIKFTKNKWVAELRSLTQYMQTNIGKKIQASCRARFGDSKCGINKATYSFTSTVSTITDNLIINCALANADEFFNGGEIEFTSGLNNGIVLEIKTWDLATQNLSLQVTAPYQIQSGDTFTVIRGCNKTIGQCQDTFANAVNFRGEPHVPNNATLING